MNTSATTLSTTAPASPQWIYAGALILLVLLPCLGAGPWQQALRLDATAVAQGQWWRLLTAHLVHLSWTHAALNAAAILICCLLAPQLFNRWLPSKVALLALGISTCLYGLTPDTLPYLGFSGVLYGLFLLGLWPQARQRSFPAITALALITAWMLWQWLNGPVPSEERLIGGTIAPIAHLFGYGLAVAGLLGKR